MKHRLQLGHQWSALRREYPRGHGRVRGGVLHWRGPIQPSDVSPEYQIVLDYRAGAVPDVRVAHPKLERREGDLPPHLYPGERLCLYLPSNGEWTPAMVIADTIIPWTVEWLLHYEIWLAVGEWTGGGAHPPLRPSTQRRARRRRVI